MNKCTCDLHDNIDESVEQVKSWNKLDTGSDDLQQSNIILFVVILVVVVAMILANVPPTI
jgi:hypothetical protein